jgi:hypothetical protein
MNAYYLGGVAADFLSNVTSERFYLRIHMTEPDQAGHGFGVTDTATGEYTEEYMQSLVDCDIGTGYILDQLETMGVLDEILVIIGADHGMYDHGHDGGYWPENRDQITTNTFILSNDSVKHELGIASYQRDIAPTILASMGVDTLAVDPAYVHTDQIGVPFWDLVDNEAPILKKAYYATVGSTSFTLIDETVQLPKTFDLNLEILDWCDDLTGVMEINGLEFIPSSTRSKMVSWTNVDLSSLESGEITLNFTLTDQYENTTNKLIIAQITDESPISLWFSLIGLMAIATVLYIKRNKH